MKNRFYVQPGWLDFTMFWAFIMIGVSFAVVLQMELIGYGPVSWPAAALLVVVLALAALQIQRSRLVVGAGCVTLRRLLPGNSLQIAPEDVTAVAWKKQTCTLVTRSYGKITFIHFGHNDALKQALAAVLPERG